MDLETGSNACEHDRLIVYSYDDEASSGMDTTVLCGYDKSNLKRFTARHMFVLVLETDDVVQGRGFLAQASTISR